MCATRLASPALRLPCGFVSRIWFTTVKLKRRARTIIDGGHGNAHNTPNYPFIMGCGHRKEQKFNVSTTNLHPSISIDNEINLMSFSLDDKHTIFLII
jgi:hypothetical protein